MAKLTKKQRAEIDRLSLMVERLERFIHRESIAICFDGEINTNVPCGPLEYRNGRIIRSQSYKGAGGAEWTIDYERVLTPIDKGIGSDLVALYDLKRSIMRFLEANI